MGEAIRAEWYDLDPEDEESFLAWCHDHYLPRLKAVTGVAWVGHYRIVEKDGRRSTIVPGRMRREADDPTVPRGRQFVLLTATPSPDMFFAPDDPLSALDRAEGERLGRRRQHRVAVFVDETVVNGPEYRRLVGGAGAPPAIQLGSFNVSGPEEEWSSPAIIGTRSSCRRPSRAAASARANFCR